MALSSFSTHSPQIPHTRHSSQAYLDYQSASTACPIIPIEQVQNNTSVPEEDLQPDALSLLSLPQKLIQEKITKNNDSIERLSVDDPDVDDNSSFKEGKTYVCMDEHGQEHYIEFVEVLGLSTAGVFMARDLFPSLSDRLNDGDCMIVKVYCPELALHMHKWYGYTFTETLRQQFNTFTMDGSLEEFCAHLNLPIQHRKLIPDNFKKSSNYSSSPLFGDVIEVAFHDSDFFINCISTGLLPQNYDRPIYRHAFVWHYLTRSFKRDLALSRYVSDTEDERMPTFFAALRGLRQSCPGTNTAVELNSPGIIAMQGFPGISVSEFVHELTWNDSIMLDPDLSTLCVKSVSEARRLYNSAMLLCQWLTSFGLVHDDLSGGRNIWLTTTDDGEFAKLQFIDHGGLKLAKQRPNFLSRSPPCREEDFPDGPLRLPKTIDTSVTAFGYLSQSQDLDLGLEQRVCNLLEFVLLKLPNSDRIKLEQECLTERYATLSTPEDTIMWSVIMESLASPLRERVQYTVPLLQAARRVMKEEMQHQYPDPDFWWKISMAKIFSLLTPAYDTVGAEVLAAVSSDIQKTLSEMRKTVLTRKSLKTRHELLQKSFDIIEKSGYFVDVKKIPLSLPIQAFRSSLIPSEPKKESYHLLPSDIQRQF